MSGMGPGPRSPSRAQGQTDERWPAAAGSGAPREQQAWEAGPGPATATAQDTLKPHLKPIPRSHLPWRQRRLPGSSPKAPPGPSSEQLNSANSSQLPAPAAWKEWAWAWGGPRGVCPEGAATEEGPGGGMSRQ